MARPADSHRHSARLMVPALLHVYTATMPAERLMPGVWRITPERLARHLGVDLGAQERWARMRHLIELIADNPPAGYLVARETEPLAVLVTLVTRPTPPQVAARPTGASAV